MYVYMYIYISTHQRGFAGRALFAPGRSLRRLPLGAIHVHVCIYIYIYIYIYIFDDLPARICSVRLRLPCLAQPCAPPARRYTCTCMCVYIYTYIHMYSMIYQRGFARCAFGFLAGRGLGRLSLGAIYMYV